MADDQRVPLRDTIEAAVEAKESEIAGVSNAAIPGDGAAPLDENAAIPGDARADDRPRGPDGKFVEKPKEPKDKEPAAQASAQAATAKAPPKASTSPTSSGLPAQAATPAAAVPATIQRPSTWKKEHWGAFDKIAQENPALAAYINQREGEYAKGVSTYKSEWDRAKPVLDALAPYQSLMQQYGVEPAKLVAALTENHRLLALGTPEQKVATFARLAQEYGVPLQQMFVRGQDGQVYLNPNLANQQAPQQQAQFDPQQVERIIEQKFMAKSSEAEITAFAAQKDEYPHFEELRETMAGLLQAGLAADLPSAYDAAMRMPSHFHLYEAQAEQQRQAAEREKAEAQRKAAELARRKAGSVRSSAPTGAAGAADGKQSLRDTISGAFDARLGAGRV